MNFNKPPRKGSGKGTMKVPRTREAAAGNPKSMPLKPKKKSK